MLTKTKVGLYAGTFDPVHEGHISLVEQTVATLGLDVVYCLPNRLPLQKIDVTTLAHREQMLRLAMSHVKEVTIVTVNTDYAQFPETIDELEVGDAEVYILLGSDAAMNMHNWRNARQLVERVKLVVGVRSADDAAHVETVFREVGVAKDSYRLLATPHAGFSSSQVRARQQSFHPVIAEYIRKHQLYKV